MIDQPMAVIVEVRAPRPQIDLVRRPTEVADDESLAGKAALQRGLEVAVVLHPLGQRVADDDQLVTFVDRQPRRVTAGGWAGRKRG